MTSSAWIRSTLSDHACNNLLARCSALNGVNTMACWRTARTRGVDRLDQDELAAPPSLTGVTCRRFGDDGAGLLAADFEGILHCEIESMVGASGRPLRSAHEMPYGLPSPPRARPPHRPLFDARGRERFDGRSRAAPPTPAALTIVESENPRSSCAARSVRAMSV